MTTRSLKFTPSHEWVKPNQDHFTIGITAHAQELLGDMVYVELPPLGTSVRAGESMAVVESVKAASDVYAPISGTITAINEALQANPGVINADPYEQGWLVKIQASDLNELTQLLSEEAYQSSLSEH